MGGKKLAFIGAGNGSRKIDYKPKPEKDICKNDHSSVFFFIVILLLPFVANLNCYIEFQFVFTVFVLSIFNEAVLL